jgi:hypothetical protein
VGENTARRVAVHTNEEGREAMREEYRHRSAPLDRPAADLDDSYFPLPRAEAGAGGTEENLIDEDPAREGVMNELVNEPARPLTDEEREAAERDPGRPERVYAPHSARVPKEPIPADEKLIRHD